MLYTFYDKGIKFGEQDEKCLADAEAKQGVKVGGDITFTVTPSDAPIPVKQKKERKKKEATKPTPVKARKGWQFYVYNKVDGTLSEPMARAALDAELETITDLSKITILTGRVVVPVRQTKLII
jgi:hypothetical protein